MKAAVAREAGQTPVYADFAEPKPAEGEVRITVTAAAMSQFVKSRASGRHYSSSGQFPFVAGVDGVGRLDERRRVYFVFPRPPQGAMAERTVVARERCLPLPNGLDDVTAAALANPGMSSWAALAERARLKTGETVLVNGATGASGRLAVQIARHLGAGKVIATGRNVEALRAVEALGADLSRLWTTRLRSRSASGRSSRKASMSCSTIYGAKARSACSSLAPRRGRKSTRSGSSRSAR